MAHGVRRATSSAAQSLTITLFPAIRNDPRLGFRSGAKHIAPEEARSLPKIPRCLFRGATQNHSRKHDRPEGRGLAGRTADHISIHWRRKSPRENRYGHQHAVLHGRRSAHSRQRTSRRMGAARNHRDAWVYGAVDPSSGTASMMELTRSLGELKQRASAAAHIVVCSWDGRRIRAHGLDGMGRAICR